MKTTLIALAATACFCASTASGHATLEQQQAEVGSTYKAVMRIGHGCDGEATLKLRITIPEGMVSVKPMPKPGWTLETKTGVYAKTYDYHGRRSEGVQEITWTGKLEDGHYDEFVFRGHLSKDAFEAGQRVHFPTVQECVKGENAWVEIPAAGQDPHDLDKPAPGLMMKAGKAHH